MSINNLTNIILTYRLRRIWVLKSILGFCTHIVQKILSVVVVGIITIAFCSYFFYSSTPEKAIYKYVFLHGNITESGKLEVHSTSFHDSSYGQQFTVEGYTGEFGTPIIYFYLKHSSLGWYITTAGTGP